MKILVALETCAIPKYAERRKTMRETWGSRLAPPYYFQEFDGPSLGVGDDYTALCEKTKAIAQYALANDFDWLIIVDDDVFVRMDQLTPPEGHDYVGRRLPPENFDRDNDPQHYYYCSGAFYWLSRKAIKLVAEAPFKYDTIRAEDRWVGAVLKENGINPTDDPAVLCDPCPCVYCLALPAPPFPMTFTAYTMAYRWNPEVYAVLEKHYAEEKFDVAPVMPTSYRAKLRRGHCNTGTRRKP